MSDFDINEDFFLEAVFTDENGDPATPQTPVQVTVRPANADSVDGPFTMSQAGTGTFQYTYTASHLGQHYWKAETADNAIKQGSFYVEEDETDT